VRMRKESRWALSKGEPGGLPTSGEVVGTQGGEKRGEACEGKNISLRAPLCTSEGETNGLAAKKTIGEGFSGVRRGGVQWRFDKLGDRDIMSNVTLDGRGGKRRTTEKSTGVVRQANQKKLR